MDPQLKALFIAITELIGLDPPSIVRTLAVQTVRDHAIPLSLVTCSDEATMTWLDEARADWGQDPNFAVLKAVAFVNYLP